MAAPLLEAKLQIPPLRGNSIPRDKLLARLNAPAPLTLLVAPPGYGKTTVLASWALSTRDHVAWLTLDTSDNDPSEFWECMFAAVQPYTPVRQPNADNPVPMFLNALHASSPLHLILDNYHTIENKEIHQSIIFLVEHLPPQIHLLIASHLSPPFPISRWRAHAQLTELLSADLRLPNNNLPNIFTNHPALANRTEGWPAGVQITLTLLETTPEDQITGAHPYFAQYFSEEVLPLISAPAQELLQQIATLDTLDIPLCDRLLVDVPFSYLIDPILKTSPFISPTDTTQRSYRIHPLFREFLLDQLQRNHPDRESELHRRAWRFLEQEGDQASKEKAISHAIAAHDLEDAARLLTPIAPQFLKTGRWTQLRHWLDQLPESLIERHPRLWITRVWLTLETYQQDTIQPYLERFDHFLVTHPPNTMQSELYAIRAIVSAMRNHPQKALKYARQAEETWMDGDALTGTYVAFALGAAFKMGDDPLPAEHWLRQTLALAEKTQNAYLAFSAHENLSDLLFLQARLPEANLHALRAIKFATVEDIEAPFTGWMRCVLGLIAFAWNDLETARTEAERSIELCQKWGNAVIQVRALILLAQFHQCRNEFSHAAQILERADSLARQTGETRFYRTVLRHRIHLSLAENNPDAVRRWWLALNSLSPDENLSAKYLHALIASRIHLAEGQPRHALHQLSAAAETYQDNQFQLYDIDRHILAALAYRAVGKPNDAVQALDHALHLAEPAKIQQPFLQAGAPMRELLRRLAAHSKHAAFIGTLLNALGERVAEETGGLSLTHRENQILRLLAAGFSNRDMAEELVIAESTLKRHVANLYLKLGVHSRTQLLAAAQEFRLL